jgi:hypothetical protein
VFHWFPYKKKFFISQCGKYLYFFMIDKSLEFDETTTPAAYIIILDAVTLQDMATVTLPELPNCNDLDDTP